MHLQLDERFQNQIYLNILHTNWAERRLVANFLVPCHGLFGEFYVLSGLQSLQCEIQWILYRGEKEVLDAGHSWDQEPSTHAGKSVSRGFLLWFVQVWSCLHLALAHWGCLSSSSGFGSIGCLGFLGRIPKIGSWHCRSPLGALSCSWLRAEGMGLSLPQAPTALRGFRCCPRTFWGLWEPFLDLLSVSKLCFSVWKRGFHTLIPGEAESSPAECLKQTLLW